MIIFPAIDIKDGKVVRLQQGKFDAVTEYSSDPVTIGKQWADKGAEWLHVVDLDGAQTGEIKNLTVIENIAKSVDIPMQMGGGIRTDTYIAHLLDAGVARVILGTKIIEDRHFLTTVLSKWPEQVVVSLDCADGMVAQRGWTDVTDLKATVFASELENLGLKFLIYTDIKRDGMMTGPNFESITELLDTLKQVSVIASGGVSSLEDIKKLCEFESKGLIGAITGKAIYEGKLDLESAIKLCSRKE